jgi:hypothetical protein
MWKEYCYNLEVADLFDTGIFKKGSYDAAEKSNTNTLLDNSLTVN